MIVIDTSVAVKWTLAEPGHNNALALFDLDEQRYAPDLLLPELTHVMRKKILAGAVTFEQAHAALQSTKTAIKQFVPSSDIAAAALSLSETLRHSAYDCYFLAVAVGSGVLVTADVVFARKCAESGYGRFIFLLEDPVATLLAKTASLVVPTESSPE